MEPHDIRASIRSFLCLFEGDPAKVEEAEARLSLALDQLALAQHYIAFDFDQKEYPDPERRSYDADRLLASGAFSDFGYYNMPERTLDKIGESDCIVADAIDDLADILAELREVEWRWTHTSQADALWHFQYNFRYHWSTHLRGLQWYLEVRRVEGVPDEQAPPSSGTEG